MKKFKLLGFEMLLVVIVELSRVAKAISRCGETADSELIIVSPRREIAFAAARIILKKALWNYFRHGENPSLPRRESFFAVARTFYNR